MNRFLTLSLYRIFLLTKLYRKLYSLWNDVWFKKFLSKILKIPKAFKQSAYKNLKGHHSTLLCLTNLKKTNIIY